MMYKRVRKLDPSSLSKADLLQLSEIVRQRVSGKANPASLVFSTETRDLQVSGESLPELLETEELPTHLRTLTVTSERKSIDGENVERGVKLEFAPTKLECTVSASDSHWVRGTFEEITSTLRRRRPSTWVFRKYFHVFFAFMIGAIAGFWISTNGFLEWPYQIALFATLYLVLLLSFLHNKGQFLSHSDILLRETKPKVTLGRAGFALSCVGTTIAALGLIR